MEKSLRDLQLATVSILDEFDRVCKKNDLTYYLGFGTLLGAVRHKGYIPWDDDIDLCMPRKDYDLFVDKYYKDIQAPYQVCYHTLENYTSFSFNFRIENSKVLISRNIGGVDKLLPSWISVFPIDGIPDDIRKQKIQEKKVSRLYTLLRFARSSINGYGVSTKSAKEKIGMLLNNSFRLGKLFDPKKLAAKINTQMRKYDYDLSQYVCIYTFDRYKYVYKKDWFGTPVLLDYEGKKYPGPADYKSFLNQCYGDYMKLPPIEQQKQSHSTKIIFADE